MNKVHVSFVLDKSGSMESVRDATISGFNEYVQTLQNDDESEYTFDLTLFDTTVVKEWVNKPIREMQFLSRETYKPNDGTALYDAVCQTLFEKKNEVPSKWVVVIMTDGEENSSRKYNETQLKEYVTLLQNTGHVTFVFLGANQDAWMNAQKWGLHQGNVAQYNSSELGTRAAFSTASVNMVTMAASANAATQDFFSQEDQSNLKNTQ